MQIKGTEISSEVTFLLIRRSIQNIRYQPYWKDCIRSKTQPYKYCRKF